MNVLRFACGAESIASMHRHLAVEPFLTTAEKDALATECYGIADAMLRAREKPAASEEEAAP